MRSAARTVPENGVNLIGFMDIGERKQMAEGKLTTTTSIFGGSELNQAAPSPANRKHIAVDLQSLQGVHAVLRECAQFFMKQDEMNAIKNCDEVIYGEFTNLVRSSEAWVYREAFKEE